MPKIFTFIAKALTLFALFGGASILLVLLVFSLGFLLLGSCDKTETKVDFECPSPDGSFIATFYSEAMGGAAGSLNEYVSVGKKGEPATEILGLNHGYQVQLEWLGPTTLRIVYPDSARVFHTQPSFGADGVGRVSIAPASAVNGEFTETKAGCVGGRPGTAAGLK